MNKLFAFPNMNKDEKSLIFLLMLRAVFVSIIVVSAYSYQGAVFLNLFPSEFLPWLYSSVSVALVAFSLPFSFFQNKYGSKKTDIAILSVLTTGLLAVIAFPQLLLRSSPLFMISIWIKLLAVFSTISFWHYTTRVFYSRRAKVLLPIIAAGFSLGSAFAGKFINVFSTIWGTQIILYILVAFSFLNISALFPLKIDFEKQRKTFHDQEKNLISRGLRLLATNRLAFYLTLFILFSIPVFLCTDFILKKAVRAYYGKDGMAAFFGNYQFYINLGVFFIQTLFMSKIMKKFGVNKITIITPFFLVLFFPIFIVFPTLTWALVFAVGASVLRLTIYINSRNQLITPFSPPEKETASLFLRTVVVPVGTVATGFILLPLKAQGIQIIAILALLISFVFLFLSFKAASAYDQELKKALKKKTLSPAFYGHSGLSPDKSLLNNLKDRVVSSSFEESSFAVSLLAQYKELELHQVEAFFEARFPHIDPVLSKIRAVDLAEFLPDSAKKEFFSSVLKQCTDGRILARVVSILSELKTKWVNEIARWLYENSTNLHKKGSGLLLLLHRKIITEDQVLLELLTSLYNSGDHKNRILAAKICVHLSEKQSEIYLKKLLLDEKPEVVNTAVALIGKFRKEKLYNEMMQLANQQRFRKTVVQAVKDADLELEFYEKHFSTIRLQKLILRLLVDSDKSEAIRVVQSKLALNRGYFTALILHEIDIRNIPVSEFVKDKSDFRKKLYKNYALYVSALASGEEKSLFKQLTAESRFWLQAIFSWLRLV
ncbi:MAG: MFS transporter, partial [Deltaproteobacteria bacterium]|nr:MFS transporter [Deltaproteobacteria bacterium]